LSVPAKRLPLAAPHKPTTIHASAQVTSDANDEFFK
jgi:hypothetical protein